MQRHTLTPRDSPRVGPGHSDCTDHPSLLFSPLLFTKISGLGYILDFPESTSPPQTVSPIETLACLDNTFYSPTSSLPPTLSLSLPVSLCSLFPSLCEGMHRLHTKLMII